MKTGDVTLVEQKHTWDDNTRTTVRMLWGLAIATIMILSAMFFVLPHLTEDGIFSKLDLATVFGVIFVAVVMSMPTVAMEMIGRIVVAIKAWRGNDG